jgi:hypothetical protein
MVYKEGPLFLRAQPLDSSPMSRCWLNKLASQKLWCLLSLSEPSCNISGVLSQDSEGGVFTSCHWLNVPSPLPGATGLCWSEGKGASLPTSWGGVFQLHKGTQKVSGTNLRAPLIRLVRTWVWIQACLRRQKGSLINSQRHLSNPLFVGETVSFRFRERDGSTVLCENVWKCEPERYPSYKVSVESQSKLVWSKVSPNGLQSGVYIDSLWPRGA